MSGRANDHLKIIGRGLPGVHGQVPRLVPPQSKTPGWVRRFFRNVRVSRHLLGDTKSEKLTLVTSQLFQLVCRSRRQQMSSIVKESGACDTESEKREPMRLALARCTLADRPRADH